MPGKINQLCGEDLLSTSESTTKAVKSQVKEADTPSLSKSNTDNQYDHQIEKLQENEKETKPHCLEESIPRKTLQEMDPLQDTNSSLPYQQEQGENILPLPLAGHDSHTVEYTHNKLPCTAASSTKKGKLTNVDIEGNT